MQNPKVSSCLETGKFFDLISKKKILISCFNCNTRPIMEIQIQFKIIETDDDSKARDLV